MKKIQKAKGNLDDEFDVIEEPADPVSDTSSCDEELLEEEQKKTDKDVDETDGCLQFQFGLKEGSKEMDERLRKIKSVRLTWSEIFGSVDKYMLGLFFKSMFFFFFCGSILVLIHLIIVYFSYPDLWYEYFPISDEEYHEQSKIMAEL